MKSQIGAPPSQGRTAVATLEAGAARSHDEIEFGSADAWWVAVTVDGRPVRQVRLADPGPVEGPGVLEAAVYAACDEDWRRLRLEQRLRRRLGARERPPAHRSVSVIVCTRSRLPSLRVLLGALGRLDPPPHELIVVDNAPAAGQDCRELAKEAGAVYVREDAPGLNRARATGAAAASGELLAFTDDDCIPPPGWLEALPELFDDANVGAVTGPAFPAALDTPSRDLFERFASFGRGWERREYDWTTLSPPDSGQAGTGANMVLEKALLDELGEVFPPELDSGTPAASGGDTYALFKVLAAGRRIVYDPRLFTYHMHRASPDALHRTIRGYGVGLSAVVTKLLLEEREFAAIRAWRWVLGQYVEAVAGGLAGRVGPATLRLSWNYLRGAIAGPAALRAAQREVCAEGPPAARTPSRAAATPAARTADRPAAAGGSDLVEVSVILLTHRRAEVAARCLTALAEQTPGTPFEVILVDDSPDGATRELSLPSILDVRRVETRAAGAARARNAGAAAARGEVLLFLDDDLLPGPDVVRRHAEQHRSEDARLVIGYSPPRPVRRTLVTMAASLWWEDHFRATRDAVAHTFVDVLSGNMSVRRETFERIGPFDPAFGRFRREDWEWGIRALESGAQVAYAPEAVAEHVFSLETGQRIDAAQAEGRGDALLLKRYPAALPSLPVGYAPPVQGVRWRALFRLLRYAPAREVAVNMLNLLEWARARKTWAITCNLVQRAAYEAGLRDGGGRDALDAGAAVVVRVQLDSDEAIRPPRAVAPVLALTASDGRETTVLPREGQWNPLLAQAAALRVPSSELRAIGSLSPPWKRRRTSLDKVAVVFGPARARGDDRFTAALTGAGAQVEVLDGPRDEHWALLAGAVRDSTRPLVALPLPGAAAHPGWLAEALVGLEGERVAAVIGGGAPDEPGERQLELLARADSPWPYPVVGAPGRYVVVRRDACATLGGLDGVGDRLGHQAALLDLVERALEAGWVVGCRDVSGLSSVGAWRTARDEWSRWRSRGTLIGQAASGRGAGWLVHWGVLPAAANVGRAVRTRGSSRKLAGVRAAAQAAGLAQGALLAPARR